MLTRLVFSVFTFGVTLLPLSAQEARPKNIIFLIGDGMGTAHVSAAAAANGGKLRLMESPVIGLTQTSSANAFVTDSAAAGTALATGVRTLNGRVGLDPEGKPVKSILHHAKEDGKATGIVVTSEVTHATPASFVAHQEKRSMAEEIAVDFVTNGPDIFIGGGWQYFRERKDGKDLTADLKEKGYFFTDKLEEALAAQGPKLAAIVRGRALPRVAERGDFLPQATRKALELLSKEKNGFFLMVEGSQIDWAGHQNDFAWLLEEMRDFDETVGVALDFAKEHGDTLVVITADHETGGLTLTGGDLSGKVEPTWGTKRHTAVHIPVYAAGVGAEAFGGFYDNTGVFARMLKLLKAEAKTE